MKTLWAAAVLAVTLAIAPPVSASGWQSVGDVQSFTPIPHGVRVQAATAVIEIDALSPSVVRVHYLKPGMESHRSFAVVEKAGFEAPATEVNDRGSAIELTTPELRVRVEKTDARVVFQNAKGKSIAEDHPGFPVAWNGKLFRVTKTMPLDEHYFGLGDKAGPIDHRDQAFTMWNTDAFGWDAGTDPLYKSIPFFVALRGHQAYGIFLDNSYRSSFDFGKTAEGMYSLGAEGGDLDYYFFYGPQPKRVVELYTALTGRPPLPPLFALGYQQSRYSYYPEARVREIASELRRRKIPADAIYLDIDYEDGYRSFTINRKHFPRFEQMVRDLGQQGFKLVAIVDLHLQHQAGYKPYDEGTAGDHWAKNPDGSPYVGKVWPGDSVFPDLTRAATRQWFGTLYKDFVAMGVRGFWNDMNEPAVFRYPEKTMPLDTVHRVSEGDGPEATERKTDHREVHNVIGMENVRATYEGVLRLKPDERPFVLTRAAFAGTQRYAASWTGDNQATWSHLRLTVPTLLSLGISGYGMVGNDVGGFDGSPTPELLTRWIEVGAFTPLFRNHTAIGTRDQEPWVHGPEHEAIRRRYIETRYRLMPYVYTTAEEMSRTGVPMMRPLFMEFPDADTLTSNSEFMLGRDLLVAPKLTEMLDAYEVKFPRGTWYDYWTNEQLAGGETRKVDPPLEVLPVYVRAGAIVPHQPLVQSTAETPRGPLELRVYPGPDCAGSVYLDDGNSFAYQRGWFLRESFSCQASKQGVRVHLDAPQGQYQPWWKQVELVVAAQKRPQRVTVAGSPVEWRFDETKHAIICTVAAPHAATEVVIEY